MGTNKYLVEPKQQLAEMTCLPTALWMLHRWYLQKIGAFNGTPDFDAYVNQTKRGFAVQMQRFRTARQNGTALEEERPDGGVNFAHLTQFSHQHGMVATTLDLSPESFETQLKDHGPFIYVVSVPHDELPLDLLLRSIANGTNPPDMGHALLITGIENRKGFMTVFFNNPATGKSAAMEFMKFIRDYRPFPDRSKVQILFFP